MSDIMDSPITMVEFEQWNSSHSNLRLPEFVKQLRSKNLPQGEYTVFNNSSPEKNSFMKVKQDPMMDEYPADLIVFVTRTVADYREWEGRSLIKTPDHFGGIALESRNTAGQVKWFEVDKFEPCTSDVVRDHAAHVEQVKKHLTELKLKTGDLVELMRPTKITVQILWWTKEFTLRKGVSGIIDCTDGTYEEPDSELDPLRGHDMTEDSFSLKCADLNINQYKLNQLLVPSVGVYFPEANRVEMIQVDNIQRKSSSMSKVSIVLPDGYMDKIMQVVNRVVNRQACDQIYEKLGLWNVCQKGRGALILLYGPPGTGKTMTAELVADRLNRPLIKVALNMFDGQLMQRLQGAFLQAQKYNAILLLDEIDVFIRKRGENPMFDENTAVFLRTLENYDGIMFMTTNLISTIDPAVFSRIHLCLGYDAATDADRRAIWDSLMTTELLASIRGTQEEHHLMLDKLAATKINGREIKTVIQNAVSHAIFELKGKPIPTGVKWIGQNYFLEEAAQLATSREGLKGV